MFYRMPGSKCQTCTHCAPPNEAYNNGHRAQRRPILSGVTLYHDSSSMATPSSYLDQNRYRW